MFGNRHISPWDINAAQCASASAWFMMFFGGAYPNVRCSHVERVMMDRKKGREDLGRLLEWDFDRLIMGHGQIVEEGGRAALKRAYKWLGAQAL